MVPPRSDRQFVLVTTSRDECLEARLVLDAVGIPCEAVNQGSQWGLEVPVEHGARATTELAAYHQEKAERLRDRIARPVAYRGAAAAVGVYGGVLLLVAWLASQSALGLDWRAAGRMEAGLVLDGQWWRVTTALTLHADAGHLLSNLIFGTVLGWFAGQILGGGVAGLVILAGGSLGNLINAMVQAPTHTSIGASTAVFAALGVGVANAWRTASSHAENPRRRFRPLVAGIVLLAFTGMGGERTDVVAHLTGFLSGLFVGWIGCRLPGRWLASSQVQYAAALAAIALLAAAWVTGLLA
jgi:membrane associated rhomboid family serine protease